MLYCLGVSQLHTNQCTIQYVAVVSWSNLSFSIQHKKVVHENENHYDIQLYKKVYLKLGNQTLELFAGPASKWRLQQTVHHMKTNAAIKNIPKPTGFCGETGDIISARNHRTALFNRWTKHVVNFLIYHTIPSHHCAHRCYNACWTKKYLVCFFNMITS